MHEFKKLAAWLAFEQEHLAYKICQRKFGRVKGALFIIIYCLKFELHSTQREFAVQKTNGLKMFSSIMIWILIFRTSTKKTGIHNSINFCGNYELIQRAT